MAQDIIVEPVEGQARVMAAEQGTASLYLVEGTRLVPRLADAVGVEENPVSRAERGGVLFPLGRVEVSFPK